jgi:hypothetical protein
MTVQITPTAAQLFIKLLDDHSHGVLPGKDARSLANELEQQLTNLQTKQNEDAIAELKEQHRKEFEATASDPETPVAGQ